MDHVVAYAFPSENAIHASQNHVFIKVHFGADFRNRAGRGSNPRGATVRTGVAHTTSEGRKGPPIEPVGGEPPSAGLGVAYPNWANIAHGPAHKVRAISRRAARAEGLGVQCKRHCP